MNIKLLHAKLDSPSIETLLLYFAEGNESMAVFDVDELLMQDDRDHEPSAMKSTLTAQHVLQFFIGGRQPPMIGFPKKIEISFSVDPGVQVSTCFLTAQFPINFRGARQENRNTCCWGQGGSLTTPLPPGFSTALVMGKCKNNCFTMIFPTMELIYF